MSGNNTTNSSASHQDFPTLGCEGLGYYSATIALCVLGITGNILSVVLMQGRGIKKRSYSLSLSVLAICNSLTLLAAAIDAVDDIMMHQTNQSFERHMNNIACKLYRFFPDVLKLMSNWVIVYITFERFVAICFPFKLQNFFSAKNSKITMATMFFIIALTQVWRIILSTKEEPNGVRSNATSNLTTATLDFDGECSGGSNKAEAFIFITIHHFAHQLFLLVLLPAICILVLNSAVIHQLFTMNKTLHTMRASSAALCRSTWTTQSTRSLRPRQTRDSIAFHARDVATRKTTILLLAVTLSFLAWIMPQLCIIVYVRMIELIYDYNAAALVFIDTLCPLQISVLLNNLAYADNFIIFLIAGESFRRQLCLGVMKFFGHCSSHCKRRYEHAVFSARQSVISRTTTTYTSTIRPNRSAPSVLQNRHGESSIRLTSTLLADRQVISEITCDLAIEEE